MSSVERRAAKQGVLGKYAYAWLTLAFFAGSFALHWWFGWLAFVDEANQHGQEPLVGEYLVTMGRDTFENWQSEFLQLLWQVVGLAYFLYIGSPSSKENDDRLEAKVDALMKIAGGEEGKRLQDELDERFLRHGGHAQPHGHSGSTS
jgi:hypothetical protein